MQRSKDVHALFEMRDDRKSVRFVKKKKDSTETYQSQQIKTFPLLLQGYVMQMIDGQNIANALFTSLSLLSLPHDIRPSRDQFKLIYAA